MSAWLLLVPILLSLFGAFILYLIKFKNNRTRNICNFILVCVTSIITFIIVIFPPSDRITLINFSHTLTVYLKIDGFGRIFAGMVSLLWPFAFLYAVGYMRHENRTSEYYLCYILTFAVVLGISFSGNLITMYFFYEVLTLVTVPLITHAMSKEAIRAGRYYIAVSLFGSALAFMGIVILQVNVHTTEFISSGYVNASTPIIRLAYLLTFFGFGVKSCIFPFHGWLPRAGVAPTPTTALLHAVAVVKSGAFAIIRTTYYVFDPSSFKGSWMHILLVLFASFTIVFASVMALKQMHLKRRLAYSTIANISYIILGVTMFSEFGLHAAIIHLIFHSFAKISLFFAAGVFMEKANVTYIDQLDGLGRKMPLTFLAFLLSGLSLIGIPLFTGFISKYYLVNAAIQAGSWYSYVGIVALLISALLTSVYILTIVIRGYFYPVKQNTENYNIAKDGSYHLMIPTLVFSFLSLILGFAGSSFIDIIIKVLGGVI